MTNPRTGELSRHLRELRQRQAELGAPAVILVGASIWNAPHLQEELRAVQAELGIPVEGDTPIAGGTADRIGIHWQGGTVHTHWHPELTGEQQETYRTLRADGTSPRKAKQLAEALEERGAPRQPARDDEVTRTTGTGR